MAFFARGSIVAVFLIGCGASVDRTTAVEDGTAPIERAVTSADEMVSCDTRPVRCNRAEPVCAAGELSQVVGDCYGACVASARCACDEAAACPHAESYTCHLYAGHCGPYVR